MATSLDVARNTVITAYEQLRVEGYLEGRVGSGTVVARDLPVDYPMVAPAYAEARSRLAKEMGLGQRRKRGRG